MSLEAPSIRLPLAFSVFFVILALASAKISWRQCWKVGRILRRHLCRIPRWPIAPLGGAISVTLRRTAHRTVNRFFGRFSYDSDTVRRIIGLGLETIEFAEINVMLVLFLA
jgi:hypothetical protein